MTAARWTGVALTITAASLVACSGNANPQTSPMSRWGDVGPDTVSGTIRQVGNLPFPRTLVDGGEESRTFVMGDLEAEISRLAGMDIVVTGTFTKGDQPGEHILATSYELEELDGEQAVVGVLVRDGAGFYVDTFDGRQHRLGQVPDELKASEGAKVWVLAAEGAHVRAFGILREAGE